MRLSTALLAFALALASFTTVIFATQAGQNARLLQIEHGNYVAMSEERDKAILENVRNLKRMDRCVQQTTANGIDLNGNLVYDRAYEALREAKMKVKP